MSVRLTKKEITEAIEAKRESDRLAKIVKAVRQKIEDINLATGQLEFVGQNPDDVIKLSEFDQQKVDPYRFYNLLNGLGKTDSFWDCCSIVKKSVDELDFLTGEQKDNVTITTGTITKITWPRITKK